MARRIFLDLDGVMFDFDGHFYELFNADPPSKGGVDDATMWHLIHNHGSFFRTMPLFPGAKEFFDALVTRGLDPIILTAASKSHYAEMAVQKRAAVREHLSTNHLVLPVAGGSAKPLFMHAPGDILIDDWIKNCDRWTKAGGQAIHHNGRFEETLLRIGMIFGMDMRRKSEGLSFQTSYEENDFYAL
jgi:hypothetical protein